MGTPATQAARLTGMQAVVSGLFVYPLKSARGIALDHAALRISGIQHDRELMVVDDDGRFVSQRSVPRLACVATALEPEGVRLWLDDTSGPREEVFVPFHSAAPRVPITIWRSTGVGDVIEAATRWISEVCGHSARIVRFTGERTVNPLYGASSDRVLYADGYAVLVVNEASRAALAEALGEAIPMDRFRPNVVLQGWPAWYEDELASLALGDVRLELVKPCGRCVMINTDQRTGARSKEPLATLARIRRDAPPTRRLDASEDASTLIPFGENAAVRAAGTIHLGAEVRAIPRPAQAP